MPVYRFFPSCIFILIVNISSFSMSEQVWIVTRTLPSALRLLSGQNPAGRLFHPWHPESSYLQRHKVPVISDQYAFCLNSQFFHAAVDYKSPVQHKTELGFLWSFLNFHLDPHSSTAPDTMLSTEYFCTDWKRVRIGICVITALHKSGSAGRDESRCRSGSWPGFPGHRRY